MFHHSISHRGLAALAMAATMAIVLSATVASADAQKRWYWSATTAEKRLEQRYSYVADASCLGDRLRLAGASRGRNVPRLLL